MVTKEDIDFDSRLVDYCDGYKTKGDILFELLFPEVHTQPQLPTPDDSYVFWL